jgi:hypothetical protein
LRWGHLRARLRHARVGGVLLVLHILLLVTYTKRRYSRYIKNLLIRNRTLGTYSDKDHAEFR